MYTIFCLLDGEMVPFPVRLDESQFRGDLKKSIREEMSDVHVEARKLELHRMDVGASDLQKAIKDVETLAPRLIPADRLNPTLDLKDVFPEGVPRKKIHILVRVPEGESFSSRPARDVAEIVLSLTTPCIVTCPHRVPTPSLIIHYHYRPVYPSLIVYHSLQSLPYRPTSTSTPSVCFVVLQRLRR